MLILLKNAETANIITSIGNSLAGKNAFLKRWSRDLFWNNYRNSYQNSLADAEKDNLQRLMKCFSKNETPNPSHIYLLRHQEQHFLLCSNRGYPMLHLPFQLLNALLEIDEHSAHGRYRHMNMVHRMIGTRIGTGGSTGKDYLKSSC